MGPLRHYRENPMQQTVLRAYRYALDPTPAQADMLASHAGSARWAYNFALALKRKADEERKAKAAALIAAGTPKDEAWEQVKAEVKIPTAFDVAREWRKIRNNPADEGGSPWYPGHNNYCFTSAFADADAAWKNWLSWKTGERKGPEVGQPKFKVKGRCRESFRLHHEVKKPTIRFAGYRRLRLPNIGEVRLHGSGKELARLVERGDAVIQSVTVSRGGHRWYASVLAKVTMDIPDTPTKKQQTRGMVGVDLGVKALAALSKPLNPDDPATALVPNARHLAAAERRLKKADRALSRKTKGSNRWIKAKRRVAKLRHQVAVRRASRIHQVTKRLATEFATIAIEDLNIAGMTRSAKGTIDAPGKNVRAKAGLNRNILDAALGEFRRQLEYKTAWYGSQLVVVDRWLPSSKTCSACGTVKETLRLSDRVFVCDACGMRLDRDLNAARNIEAAARL